MFLFLLSLTQFSHPLKNFEVKHSNLLEEVILQSEAQPSTSKTFMAARWILLFLFVCRRVMNATTERCISTNLFFSLRTDFLQERREKRVNARIKSRTWTLHSSTAVTWSSSEELSGLYLCLLQERPGWRRISTRRWAGSLTPPRRRSPPSWGLSRSVGGLLVERGHGHTAQSLC